jgi:hypothetical protein
LTVTADRADAATSLTSPGCVSAVRFNAGRSLAGVLAPPLGRRHTGGIILTINSEFASLFDIVQTFNQRQEKDLDP